MPCRFRSPRERGDAAAKTAPHAGVDGQILATPAIVDGRIYVRTKDHLYAFGR
jgi:hypothetical protein